MRRVASAILLAGLLGAGEMSAGDHGFDHVVRNIESEYGARRLRIPLLGLVNAIVKVARPAGTSELRLAVFEDLDLPASDEDRFGDIVGAGLDTGWRPLVRVRSRRGAEWTSIYVRDAGKRMKLLLAACEPGEATLIQVKVNPKVLGRWLREPEMMAGRITGGRDSRP